MNKDFDWSHWVLIYPSNLDFLRGETMRIRDDIMTPFDAVWNALLSAFCVAFVAHFIWKGSLLVTICALTIGICAAIVRFRNGAKAIARRREAVLIEGELLTAKSDRHEFEGTIFTYRFTSPDGQLQNEKGYADVKPDRFKAGDKLIILYASDGTHTVL